MSYDLLGLNPNEHLRARRASGHMLYSCRCPDGRRPLSTGASLQRPFSTEAAGKMLCASLLYLLSPFAWRYTILAGNALRRPMPVLELSQNFESQWHMQITRKISSDIWMDQCSFRNFPVTPTPNTFSKVLPYKWEAYCSTNGMGFPFFKASKPGRSNNTNGLPYKLEVYCRTVFETSRGRGSLSGLPNANAKSPRFSYAISQIAHPCPRW